MSRATMDDIMSLPDLIREHNLPFEVVIHDAPVEITLMILKYWKVQGNLHLITIESVNHAVKRFHDEFVGKHLSVDVNTYNTAGEKVNTEQFLGTLGPLNQVINAEGFIQYHMFITGNQV